jgi:2-amino-4-hydroxy-6-hydroxymethyldihydropteridine diphosphokinase
MEASMNKFYLSLGSNIEPENNLPRAVALLEGFGKILAASKVYETPPLGFKAQAHFLNAAVIFSGNWSLEGFQEEVIPSIEKSLNRVRTANKNAPRTIDIDIIFFNDQIRTFGKRSVPNREVLERDFVALPLAELEPEFIHPQTGQTLAEIAATFQGSVQMKARDEVVLLR